MRTVGLFRTIPTATEMTGVLLIKGFHCYTLERPWKNNIINLSCIPVGSYVVERDITGKQQFYRILDVEGRSDIEIHPAGYVNDLLGCIALADALVRYDDRVTAVDSRIACNRFLNHMGDDSFVLNITLF